MTAQEILKLIEEVSPDDTAKLDEIDDLVEKFVCPDLIISRDENGKRCATYNGNTSYITEPFQYTRSRDALKAIRPDGFRWEVGSISNGKFYCHMTNRDYLADDQVLFSSHVFHFTEELSELAAIIQAIEYERNNA